MINLVHEKKSEDCIDTVFTIRVRLLSGTLGTVGIHAMCLTPAIQPTRRSMPMPAPAEGLSLPSFAIFSTNA